IGQQRHLYSSPQSNEPWQRVSAAPIRNQADARKGFEQASIIGRDAYIASQGDVQADTSCYALHGSDDWFGHVTDRQDQAMVLRQVVAGFERFAARISRSELREVLPCPKCSPGTSEHDAADRLIRSSGFDGFYEFFYHERIHRVQHVGAVHGERDHVFVLLNEYVLESSSH